MDVSSIFRLTVRNPVGPDPVNVYLQEEHGVEWDVDNYKKDLPRIEANYKKYLDSRQL